MHRLVTTITAAALLGLAGCASGGAAATSSSSGSPSPTATPKSAIEAAADSCSMTTPNVGDGGTSITFDTEGKDDPSTGTYDSIEDVACVLNALKVPDYVVSHIDDTRALDGMQEDTWGPYTARWTYHPDNGVALTIFEKQ